MVFFVVAGLVFGITIIFVIGAEALDAGDSDDVQLPRRQDKKKKKEGNKRAKGDACNQYHLDKGKWSYIDDVD